MERRITELDVCKEGFKKEEDDSEAITNGDIVKIEKEVVILCRDVVMVKNSLPGCLIFMTAVSRWK